MSPKKRGRRPKRTQHRPKTQTTTQNRENTPMHNPELDGPTEPAQTTHLSEEQAAELFSDGNGEDYDGGIPPEAQEPPRTLVATISVHAEDGPGLWALIPRAAGGIGWDLANEDTPPPTGVDRAIVRGMLEHALARLA